MQLTVDQFMHSLRRADADDFVYARDGVTLHRCSVVDCPHYYVVDLDGDAVLFLCHEHVVALDGPHEPGECPLCDRQVHRDR